MVAPAGEGQFGNASMADLAEGIRQLGFADMYEVALGGILRDRLNDLTFFSDARPDKYCNRPRMFSTD